MPNLRELKASNTLAASIISCPMTNGSIRPLETLKGVKLSGYATDTVLVNSLRFSACGQSIKRLELVEWSDLDAVRNLLDCIPNVAWLDLGNHGRMTSASTGSSASTSMKEKSLPFALPMQTNVSEWAELLALVPELITLHGPRFFYPASALALSALTSHTLSSSLPASEYSRVRTNQNTAITLLSKCSKLRRLEHWEDRTSGKVVILGRHAGEVRLEVKRVKI